MRHTKSPCCQASIRRFGKRRRQCSICLKTWRLYKHKRGRKPKRRRTNLVRSLFVNNFTIGQLLRAHPKIDANKTLFSFRKQLQRQAERSYKIYLPKGPLTLIVDGFWFRLQGHIWVLYICAVKPRQSSTAWIISSRLIKGKERLAAWQRVISSLPAEILDRVEAFVSDGFRGSARIAHKYGWIHQRCHFHLLAQLYRRQGHRKKTILFRDQRKLIISLVRRCLIAAKQRSLAQLRIRLTRLIDSFTCPPRYRQIVREFLRHLKAFRAYLNHPQMNLPITTGCLESYGKGLRKYTNRLNTPMALIKWSKAYVIYHPTVACNGKIFNQI